VNVKPTNQDPIRAATGNPKAESRRPKEGRRPKPEEGAIRLCIRLSGFGFLSAFGFRPSDFKPNASLRPPWLSRSILHVFAPVALLAALAGCERPTTEAPQKSAPPVTVQTVLPKRGEISRTITLPAFRILAYQEATLYAKVSGYLKTLTVDKGDAVKEGQLLAEIEVPELLADEIQYMAETAVSRTICAANGKSRKPNCSGPKRCCSMPELSLPSTA
jgi:hypothetical protein